MSGGTAASALIELERATDVPPAGAAALSVTVPVEVVPLPPAMLDGLSVSDVTAGPDRAAAAEMNESETVSIKIGAARCRITVPPVGGSGCRSAAKRVNHASIAGHGNSCFHFARGRPPDSPRLRDPFTERRAAA